MRIIAGTWKGRVITAPAGQNTRPTSDRVREALFSSLTSHFGSWTDVLVLDAFAGSGALGLEALSRGARFATFAECEPKALAALKENISRLEAGGRTEVLGSNIERVIGHPRMRGPVSLLLLDPPYRINKSEVRGLIEGLADSRKLAHDALIVWEHASREDVEWPTFVESTGRRRYGSTELDIGIVSMSEEGQ